MTEPEFKIQPEYTEVNLIPIGLEDIPVYASGVSTGLPIDATPAPNTPIAKVKDSNIIPSGGGSIIKGFLKSQNYNEDTAGWAINGDGTVDFESGNFRGDITGASGTFSGTITATAGSIGGWTISANAIYHDGATDNVSSGMASADYPFYAGKKYADRATAPFKVEPSGKLTCTDIVATGTINAQDGYLSAGVYVDTVNGIVCESGGLNVGNAGHIRGGQTDYDTGTGFFLGYSTTYKLSIGDGTAANSLTWDGTDLTVKGQTFSFQNTFGNGADGDVTISSDTTLTGDMYYDDLTINATKTLSPAGYRIFVKGTLTVNGTISRVGTVGATGDGGGGGGAAIASGYLGAGGAGGNGGSGAGENGQAGGSVTSALGGNGGAGGGTTNGAGTATAPPANSGEFKAYPAAVYLYDAIVGARIFGGGGGSGGEGASNLTGGGGGSAGGVICICAKTIVVGAAGVITTKGGAGGEGEAGNGYGGGGGGGADIIFTHNSLTNSGSITADGGAGGAGAAGAGSAGSAGTITYLEI